MQSHAKFTELEPSTPIKACQHYQHHKAKALSWRAWYPQTVWISWSLPANVPHASDRHFAPQQPRLGTCSSPKRKSCEKKTCSPLYFVHCIAVHQGVYSTDNNMMPSFPEFRKHLPINVGGCWDITSTNIQLAVQLRFLCLSLLVTLVHLWIQSKIPSKQQDNLHYVHSYIPESDNKKNTPPKFNIVPEELPVTIPKGK